MAPTDVARSTLPLPAFEESQREVAANVLQEDVAAGARGGGEHAGVDFERIGCAGADRTAAAGDGDCDVVGPQIARPSTTLVRLPFCTSRSNVLLVPSEELVTARPPAVSTT